MAAGLTDHVWSLEEIVSLAKAFPSMRIERIKPRCPSGEYPYQAGEGLFELGDPNLGQRFWHLSKNAIRVKTIEKAAELIENRHFGIRMHCAGKRPSLISRGGIRIVRP